MKKLSLLIVLVVVCSLSYSQKYSIQIGVNYQKMPTSESSDFHQFSSSRFSDNPMDSTFTIVNFQREDIIQNEYFSKIGYNSGINIRFPLTEKISFETGIHFQFSKFETRDSLVRRRIGVISIDTVKVSEPSNLNAFYCSNINDFFEISNTLDESKSFSIINVLLPVKFYYELMENELAFSVGSYITTDIFSRYYTERVRIDYGEVVDEQVICTFHPDIIDDSSGSNLRNFNFGVTVGAEYWFGKWGTEILIDQRFTNIFAENDTLDSQFQGHSSIPSYFNIALKYRFKNKTITPSNVH